MGKKHQNKGGKNNKITANNKQNELLTRLCDNLLVATSSIPLHDNQSKNAWEAHLKYEEIKDKIKLIQKDNGIFNDVGNRSNEYLNTFITFMKTNGALFENLELETFPNLGLGVKTLKPISQGDLIMAIPKSLMLSIETVDTPDIKKFLNEDPILQTMPNVSLAFILLYEKFRSDSFWKPYIDILPDTYSTVLYFTSDELLELKGSSIFEGALKQCKNIARQYAYFKTLPIKNSLPAIELLLGDRFTYEEYRWAVSTIMTRQNIIPAKDGKTMITALIPFWDMINHKNGIMSTDFNPKLNQSECLAFEDFKANDQVFMFYGDRTNADMFLHNGFVYPDNENDGYSLRLGISKSDKLSAKRIKILEKLKLYEQMTFMLRPKPKSISDNLLKFVKVFIMNEDEINSLEKLEDQSKIIEKLNTSGDELNKRCYRFLSTRLMILLNAYPTKLDDDIALLKNDDNQLTECKKVAINLRILEKKILNDNKNYLDELLK